MKMRESELRLLVEPVNQASPVPDPAGFKVETNALAGLLRLPPGPSMLSLAQDGRPQLRDLAGSRLTEGVVVKPLRNRFHQQRLLVVNRTAHTLRVNGQPAPRVAALKEKDNFRWTGEAVFHVTAFHQPNIGSPSARLLGKECPICRVPFSDDTNCYVCACGTAVHCEDSAAGLQCAHLRADCPSCRRPIVLVEGYSYLPEFEHE